IRGVGAPALPAGPLRPRPGVLAARALDAMALYDSRREQYITLNPVATRIWDGLDAGQLPVAIVDWLSAEYEMPIAQVAADVAVQLANWLRDGLIEQGVADHGADPAREDAIRSSGLGVTMRQVPQTHRTPDATGAVTCEVKVLTVLWCALTIAWIKWLLRTRRFQGTIAWVRGQVEPTLATEAAELEAVRELEYAVAMAGAFYPGRAKCLEQSLALYYLARRQGVAVRYCRGVQLYPFEAHAWVEYQGQVITDVPEHVKYFTRFPDELP
ncbi:MAG: lasso peptide biosynthesis B2 protein, partial [Gemmatimonadaceae bacterium]